MVSVSRRQALQLTGAIAAGAALPLLTPTATTATGTVAPETAALNQQILEIFNRLSGQKAFYLQSLQDEPSWQLGLNPNQALFCGSSFKVFVLAEFLRQLEAGRVTLTELLPVDDSVRSLSSRVLQHVTGKIPASVALEAMIMHSDNTATDMVLRRVGIDAVRAFIQSIGLSQTKIPDSTRIFFSYLLGADVGEDLGWEAVSQALANNAPGQRPIINDQQTMLSTPTDFVSFYARALQGEFFQKPATLREFRRILNLPTAITALDLPQAHVYLKGGSIDFFPDYVMSTAGGMRLCNDRWVYFSFLQNWQESDAQNAPTTVQKYVQANATILQAIAIAFGSI